MRGHELPKSLTKKMREALDESGLPWSLKKGSKHWHISINGAYVGSLSYGKTYECTPNLERHILTKIRRLTER
jgi:hypothetical protein